MGETWLTATDELIAEQVSAEVDMRRRVDQALAARDREPGSAQSRPMPLRRATGPTRGRRVDDRLIELDYGEWDGRPLGDISAERVGRLARRSGVRAPGRREPRRRRPRASSILPRRARRRANVVAVSHVSPIKAAVCWALGVDERATWRMQLGLATITDIGARADGMPLPRVVQRRRGSDARGHGYSTVRGIDRRAGGRAWAPVASTMKRPSPGPSATGMPSASSSAWSSSGERPIVVR